MLYLRSPLASGPPRALGALAVLVALAAGGCSALFPANSNQGATTTPGGWVKHPIRLDGLGFLPERAKLATVIAPGGTSFDIKSAADDRVVWSAPLEGPMTDNDTGDDLWLADFSTFTDTGEFYLEVTGLGQSAHFQIAADVFREALVRAMMSLHGQRCGSDVTVALGNQTWSHKSCHTHDAYLTYLTGADTIQPSTGGWHDAGDYGKYVTNGAFTVGMLLQAWERFGPALMTVALPIPEHGGAIPDFLAEVKWEIDWLFSTQGADGSVSHKVTALNFEGFVLPEQDGARRYYTGIGTGATADLTAVMAAAARIYQPFDAAFAARCLAAAQLGYGYLTANPGYAFPDLTKFHTGGYGDRDDTDERLWAAAEMWETTGDAAALADLEGRLPQAHVEPNFDWGNVANLGLFTYVASARNGRNPDLLVGMRASAVTSADTIAATASASGYGRGVGSYWWGSNGAVARTSMNLAVANLISPDTKYLDAIVAQLDHLLGRNAYDRSQVTALGYHPPIHPHHRPSASDSVGDPWPGLLVGGQDDPLTQDWTDSQDAYNVNEVAINWSGAFAYAAAALLH